MKFWRMTGLISASPVDTIMDKGNFTLEELLDEEETVQEYRARNGRLINYLRNRVQLEQLLNYIVKEAPEDAEEKQIFKFPYIACEIFICEVDVVLSGLAEDEELMSMLFTFLKPDHPHSASLSGYFSKVVICLMIRKTATLMNYVQEHLEILHQLVDLIGITSIMEVIIRLIGADEYAICVDETHWLKDTDVLEMIVDKFSSSDSPQVHANAAEVLCAVIRYAPPGFAGKISSSSFMGRLFHHALEVSRPKSALVHSLSVCITLLDPKRIVSSSYNLFRSHRSHGSLVVAEPETVDKMVESLSDLLKILDVSSAAIFSPTTYGYLKPPFGKHRLKIVEFISVLLTIGSEAAERELVEHGAIKHILDMFFEYPFNNFLHRNVENIIGMCIESKSAILIEHLFQDCDIINKILGAEKEPFLMCDDNKPTIATRGRSPPRIGNLGHLTHIANKLIQSAECSNTIHVYLQENKDWVNWHANVLVKRNATQNLYRWTCGRPNALEDQLRYNDNGNMLGRGNDVLAPVNNLDEPIKNEDSEENVSMNDQSSEITAPRHLAENSKNVSLTSPSSFSNEEDKVGSDSNTNIDEPGSSIVDSTPIKDPRDTTSASLHNDGDELGELTEPLVDSTIIKNPKDTLSASSPLLNDDDESSELIESRHISDSSDLPDSDQSCSENYELKADDDQLNGEVASESEGWRDTSASNELSVMDETSQVHKHKEDEDQSTVNAKRGIPRSDNSSPEIKILRKSEVGNPSVDLSEESIHMNTEMITRPSEDGDADMVVTVSKGTNYSV